ncbi:MAG: S1C family serine protease [Sphingopyxis sp.]
MPTGVALFMPALRPIARRLLPAALLMMGSAMLIGAVAPTPAIPAPAPARAPAAPAIAPTPAPIDDIAATNRSVVRVVTVAIVNGEVVGFGHGSGFAIAPNRIVTNAHVVAQAQEYPENVVIGIVPSEGSRSYPGRVVRVDSRRDLAIVELDGGRLPAVSLFTNAVSQRQNVYALGYPGNVDLASAQNMDDFIRPRSPVASDGIISSTDTVNGVAALVHDADIARGNSGGPLVDACGRVVGVNSFISRADDGDSPFSFAVTVRELAAFLQGAGQHFTGVATPCVTAAESSARSAAQSAEERRIARETADAARQAQLAKDAEDLSILRAAAQDRRDNFMALSFLLFGIGILAGAASFVYQIQEKPRERRAAILSALLLAGGAIILFLMRPSAGDVHLDRSDPLPANEASSPQNTARGTPAGATATPSTSRAPRPVAVAGYGRLLCRVDRNRGRITVSTGDDTVLSVTPGGCVNGRTQYSAAGSAGWSRTLVPDHEATVSRLSYNPATQDYVVKRYLLSMEGMDAVRRQRTPLSVAGCTANPAVLAQLTRRESAITAHLPAQPNEEIVSHCTVQPAD